MNSSCENLLNVIRKHGQIMEASDKGDSKSFDIGDKYIIGVLCKDTHDGCGVSIGYGHDTYWAATRRRWWKLNYLSYIFSAKILLNTGGILKHAHNSGCMNEIDELTAILKKREA